MNKVTVLYDDRCGLCIRCASWLLAQPAHAEIEALPRGSRIVRSRYPALATFDDELVVIVDDRHVYREAKAWLVCLHALRGYRSWARRLASPALMPLARQAFHLLSSNRLALSTLIAGSDADVRARLEGAALPACDAAEERPS